VKIFSQRFSPLEFNRLEVNDFKKLKIATPFVVAGLFSVIYNREDIFFLTAFRSNAEVGWYNAAYRIIEAQMFIPVSVVGAVFPVLTKHFYENPVLFKSMTNKTLLILVCLGGLVGLFTILFSSPIIKILYRDQFTPSIGILSILCFLLPFYFGNSILGNALIAARNEKFSTLTIGMGAILNAIFCFLLIPSRGIEGAAFARVLTEICAAIIQGAFLLRIVQRIKNSRSS